MSKKKDFCIRRKTNAGEDGKLVKNVIVQNHYT